MSDARIDFSDLRRRVRAARPDREGCVRIRASDLDFMLDTLENLANALAAERARPAVATPRFVERPRANVRAPRKP